MLVHGADITIVYFFSVMNISFTLEIDNFEYVVVLNECL